MRLDGSLGQDARTANGRSLARLFVDRCEAGRDTTAMRAKRHGAWRPFSWREVESRVRAIAAGMDGLGIQAGDTVAAVGENVVELYWIEYAAICRGARIVCFYPDASASELADLVAHSGAKLLFAEDQEQVDKALEARGRLGAVTAVIYTDERGLWQNDDPWLMRLDELMARGGERDRADPDAFGRAVAAVRPSDIAVLCYTSGTTGRPKGVMLSHTYLLDNAYRLLCAFGLRPGTEYLSYISPAWAAEQMTGLALGLLAPLTVNFAEKPETVRADLRELGPEFLLFTPRQWESMASEVQSQILDAPPWRQRLYEWCVEQGRGPAGKGSGALRRLADWLMLAGIRDNLGLDRTIAALSGGGGMSADVFRLFRAYGIPLSNLYGSTELGLVAAHWGGPADPATMGELLPSDPTIGAPLALEVSEGGELVVAGGAHFAGYYRDEAATSEVWNGRDLSTGDAATVDAAGHLVFLDRIKDLRSLAGGERYPPQFIENNLRASPFIKDAMVIGDESRPFVTALINIDSGIAGRFAERRGLAFGTFTELSQLEPICEQIGQEVRRINALLSPGARLRRFATLPKELDPDEAELTRSRKLRRDRIEDSYRDIVEALYDGARTCQATVRVRYQDGQVRELAAAVAINDAEPGLEAAA